MPTLSATLVLRPQRVHRACEDCGKSLGPHIKLFGMAEAGDRPSTLRYCIRCANKLQGDQIKALVARFRRVVDAQSCETVHWKQIVASLSGRR